MGENRFLYLVPIDDYPSTVPGSYAVCSLPKGFALARRPTQSQWALPRRCLTHSLRGLHPLAKPHPCNRFKKYQSCSCGCCVWYFSNRLFAPAPTWEKPRLLWPGFLHSYRVYSSVFPSFSFLSHISSFWDSLKALYLSSESLSIKG